MEYKEIKTVLNTFWLFFGSINISSFIISIIIFISSRSLENTLITLFWLLSFLNLISLFVLIMTKAENIRLYDDKILFIRDYVLFKKEVVTSYKELNKIDWYYLNRQEVLEFVFNNRKSFK